MLKRHPVPPAFRAGSFWPVGSNIVQLRLWSGLLIERAQSYRQKEFPRG